MLQPLKYVCMHAQVDRHFLVIEIWPQIHIVAVGNPLQELCIVLVIAEKPNLPAENCRQRKNFLGRSELLRLLLRREKEGRVCRSKQPAMHCLQIADDFFVRLQCVIFMFYFHGVREEILLYLHQGIGYSLPLLITLSRIER